MSAEVRSDSHCRKMWRGLSFFVMVLDTMVFFYEPLILYYLHVNIFPLATIYVFLHMFLLISSLIHRI